jgi:hypothetical protein
MAVVDELVIESPRAPAVARPRLVWWREIGLVTAFYLVYADIRNARGHHEGTAAFVHAQTHAFSLIGLERRLGLFHEHAVQALALHSSLIVKVANGFYTTAHFVVTLGVLIWLYRCRPGAYRRWRWVLAVTTASALIGFAVYPVLPPRLLPPDFGFVDTLGHFGGLWTFNSGAIERISDPFAAMPSLHLGWASWCAAAVWTTTRSRRIRYAALAYPVVTAIVVIVTGNHYLLDVLAGVAVFAGATAAVSSAPALWLSARTWRATRRATAA